MGSKCGLLRMARTNLISQDDIGCLLFRLICLQFFNKAEIYVLVSSFYLYSRVLAIAVLCPSNILGATPPPCFFKQKLGCFVAH